MVRAWRYFLSLLDSLSHAYGRKPYVNDHGNEIVVLRYQIKVYKKVTFEGHS